MSIPVTLHRVNLPGGYLFTQGAHLCEWTPAGHRPVLFLSAKNSFEPGKPIRGGVPIIFPWFGSRPEGTHGYARTRIWELQEQTGNEATLTLDADPFELKFRVVTGDALSLELEVRNTCEDPQQVEMALHTYLEISDIGQVAVSGLDGTEYLDKTDEFRRKKQTGDIQITSPTDRVYLNTPSTCILHDSAWKRRITIEKTGSNTTVVWNPYTELADLDNWRGMICIETANAAENAITLEPGATHTMTAHISVAHGS